MVQAPGSDVFLDLPVPLVVKSISNPFMKTKEILAR